MNSLTTLPTAQVLSELFATADHADQSLEIQMGELSAVEREETIQQLVGKVQDGYRGFYEKMRGNYLAISPELGRLLYILARGAKARLIVEFGTSFGISAIHLASALRDNGGGTLITTEFQEEKAARARENLTAAGMSDLVEIRVGDALETLKDGVPGGIDLLFLDGAKGLYLPILKLLEPKLAAGALVITDNTAASSPYLDYVRAGNNGYLSLALPFEEGNELSVRVQ
jgi:predicted O-methyltransferase YrrM